MKHTILLLLLLLLLLFFPLCAPVTVQDTYKPHSKPEKVIKLKLPEKKKSLLMLPYPEFILDSTLGDWLDTVKINYDPWE